MFKLKCFLMLPTLFCFHVLWQKSKSVLKGLKTSITNVITVKIENVRLLNVKV